MTSYLVLKTGRLSPRDRKELHGPQWLNTYASKLDGLGLSHGFAMYLLRGLSHDLTSLGFDFLISEMASLQSYCEDQMTHYLLGWPAWCQTLILGLLKGAGTPPLWNPPQIHALSLSCWAP